MSQICVALVFGGCSAEHEISVMSARAVYGALDQNKYNILPVGITSRGLWVPPDKAQKVLKKGYSRVDNVVPEEKKENIAQSLHFFLDLEIDVVFPVLHGPYGEDGRIQGFLDMINLPCVGSGVLGSALAMDKIFTKKVLDFHDLPQADFVMVNKKRLNNQKKIEDNYFKKLLTKINKQLGYPCFVKPANMGSSIGVSRVRSQESIKSALDKAFAYDSQIIVEPEIKGREIECSVLALDDVCVSQPGEIMPEADYYDYYSKYEGEATELLIPADLEPEVKTRICQLAEDACRALKVEGMCRVDFFYNEQEDNILINELNTIPGFTQYSMYPKLWEVSGIDFSNLVDRLIKGAVANFANF